MMKLMYQIANRKTLSKAFEWCCKAREEYPASSDIWILRERWESILLLLQAQLLAGTYRFSPMEGYVTGAEGSHHFWSATDAVVIKAISLVLTEYLQPKLSRNCTHVRGNGGMTEALRILRTKVSANEFFVRSDIKDYYASINHEILLQQLSQLVDEPEVLALIKLSLNRLELHNGQLVEIRQGIPLRSSLSPLLAAIALNDLDQAMDKLHISYVRFMDDWVILAANRSRLKKHIRLMYQVLNKLKLIVHPDKTRMGRIAKGISFLGFILKHKPRLELAGMSLQKLHERVKFILRKKNINYPTKLVKLRAYAGHYLAWLRGVSLNWQPLLQVGKKALITLFG